MAVARRLVEDFHYAAGASKTATHIHGLFRAGELFDERCQGVAWWLPPTKAAAVASYPSFWRGVLSLSRLVIAPDVPANACSFLLARSRRLIDAEDWPCLVTYADEWRGHTGSIYLADNWRFVGMTSPRRTYVIGKRMVSPKAGPKTRTHEQMLALGAECVGSYAKRKFVLIRESTR